MSNGNGSPIILLASSYGVVAIIHYADGLTPPMAVQILARKQPPEIALEFVSKIKEVRGPDHRPVAGVSVEIWDDRHVEELVKNAERHNPT